jgi:hypothetical protein
MDRTTSRRLYNEFTAEIDINRPDGILRSSDVDKYIEKALKPLIEEGKAFKSINVNRRTGIRSTRYSYQGGKNIQNSINAILANMHASLGYDVDPVTGNADGTDMPPPMSVTNQGRRYYNETRERILDPRAAAAIKADALRAGGVSNTNKASGYTTTLIRAGLPGETRRMRKLVDDTDKKYFAGELPSSALAEGASPATIEERARASIARQANLKDAKRAAIEDYIKAHPYSQLAVEEAIKMHKVTNREEKERLLEAERTPGTPEFHARIGRGLDRQAARNGAAVAWAKQNKRNRLARPLAKQILKASRMKTRTGRALEKSKAVARTAVIGAIVGAISVAVTAAVKFLSQLPAIAQSVHKIAVKGQTYNMAEQKVREYEAIEKSARLDSGAFSSVFGGMVSTLSDIVTGGMPETVSKVAALLSIAGQAPIDAIVRYTTGTDKDVEKLFREMFNGALRISFQGKDTTHRFGGLSFSAALAENAQVMEKAFPGMGNILLGFGNAANKLTKEQLEEAKNSDDIFGYLVNALNKPALVSARTATNVEHHEADRVAGVFAGVKTALENIRDGILAQILAALEPLASWLMIIAKGILANPVFKGKFDNLVASLDAADNEKNVAALAANTVHLRTLETVVPVLASKMGYKTPEQRENVLRRFEKFGEIPSSVRTREQFEEFFNYVGQERSLRIVRETNKRLNYEVDKFTTGAAESLTKPGKIDRYAIGSTAVVPNATAAQVGIKASSYIQTEAFDAVLEADKALAESGPVSQRTLLQKAAEIKRGREALKHRLEVEGNPKLYGRKYKPEEIAEALRIYDNEHAQEMAALQWLYALGKDGTPAKPGEARAYLNSLSRREQREITTELTAIEAIKAQASHLFENVLNGAVRVEGGPDEGKREYVIRLIDTRTGREHVIRDVHNVGGGSQSFGLSNLNLADFLESFSPTQPN